MNYLASPPLLRGVRARRCPSTWDVVTDPAADAATRTSPPSGRASASSQRRDRAGDRVGHVPEELREVFEGNGVELAPGPGGRTLRLGPQSTYVTQPPYSMGARRPPRGLPHQGARSSPSSATPSPRTISRPPGPSRHRPRAVPDRAWRRCDDFNLYGARRGNHEVMTRGTFANVRLATAWRPGTEGGWTVPDGEQTSIYAAAMAYGRRACRSAARGQGVRLGILARLGGQGPAPARGALRHRRVFERIHR